MAPAITRVCAAGLGPPLVRVAVQPHGQGLVAFACGGSTVVVPRALVLAVHHGRVSHEQAAASIAHAAAICSAGLTRGQVALAVWCLPWVALEGVVAAAGRMLRGSLCCGWRGVPGSSSPRSRSPRTPPTATRGWPPSWPPSSARPTRSLR
jgi:hypothetical protein